MLFRAVKLLLFVCVVIGFGLLAQSDSTMPRISKKPWQTGDWLTMSTPIQESCFSRTVLVDHLDEPIELAISTDGRVFFIDRYGGFHIYDPVHKQVRRLNRLNVSTQHGTGLLGIALAPDFKVSGQVYLYYTPNSGSLRQRLSRFTLKDSLLYATERVLLEIPWEVESNAHTGGSMAFDEDGNLFLSVGDNTAAFVEDGFASIDERPSRQVYDAQRSAANTKDLRGKILRIHPEPNGGYTIPNGNLFAKDGQTGRPEIYIMGCRNPYRITYDSRIKTLYWGEIGPDDGKDGQHGPRGYDEINQASGPGNYGWPYVIADNKPYRSYNFETDQFGGLFNPDHLTNQSVNNRGAQQLPPAQKALIWYPYETSDLFPQLGEGGRAAMVGAVYHYRPSQKQLGQLPAYYDQALFAFDWMRNQITAIWIDKQGRYQRMEPFMSTTDFDKPIDLAFDPNGVMYLLEYGEGFWVKNQDASLVRITYGLTSPTKPMLAEKDDLLSAQPIGQQLISRSDCRSCHTLTKRTAAPSFREIARRYHHKKGAAYALAQKVIRGGGGTWGPHVMSAHPQLNRQEATEMVDYILSLTNSSD